MKSKQKMGKISHLLSGFLFLLLLSVGLSCEKTNSDSSKEEKTKKWKPSPGNTFEKNLDSIKKNTLLRTEQISDYSCSSTPGSDYYGQGYYAYPDYNLSFTSSAQGSTITIVVYSYDIPNRFTIKDANNITVASTSWMGYVNYSGPWGSSLNTAQNQTLTFTKDVASSFVLKVETVAGNNYSDSWSANISCTAPSATWINPGNIGAFHNNILTAVDNSFSSEPTSWLSADNYSKGYENTYVSNNSIDLPSSVVDSSFGFRNKLLHTNYTIGFGAVNWVSITDSMMNLSNTSVLMTTTEKTMMEDLFDYYALYASGSINYSTMKSNIASLKTTWGQQGFNTSLHQGDISAYTLNIADSSVTFWYNYTATYGTRPEFQQRTQILPGWVAADAAGAIGGAIGAGLDSYNQTGKVNWRSVGWWALGGAVAGSLNGARWFKNLFNW